MTKLNSKAIEFLGYKPEQREIIAWTIKNGAIHMPVLFDYVNCEDGSFRTRTEIFTSEEIKEAVSNGTMKLVK